MSAGSGLVVWQWSSVRTRQEACVPGMNKYNARMGERPCRQCGSCLCDGGEWFRRANRQLSNSMVFEFVRRVMELLSNGNLYAVRSDVCCLVAYMWHEQMGFDPGSLTETVCGLMLAGF